MPCAVTTGGGVRLRAGGTLRQIKHEQQKAAYLPSSSYSWYSSVKRVQVVVAMMFPPRTAAGVRNERRVAADRRTSGLVSAHLKPPGGAADTRERHTRFRLGRTDGRTDGGFSSLPGEEDGLF